MIFGTVIKCLGGLYTVKLDEEFKGENYVNVRGRGSFRHEKLILLAGDRVELEPLDNGDFFCKKILERKNSLIRPPLANLDIIFAVIPCVKPQPDLQIVDKMLSIAEHNKIEPVIVITKADLDMDFANNIYEIYKKCGFNVFITSSENNNGVDDIYSFIKEISQKEAPLCAFAGVSGAGKSTLLNAIFPNLKLETGELTGEMERIPVTKDSVPEANSSRDWYAVGYHIGVIGRSYGKVTDCQSKWNGGGRSGYLTGCNHLYRLKLKNPDAKQIKVVAEDTNGNVYEQTKFTESFDYSECELTNKLHLIKREELNKNY